ncbi:MAG: glutamyl-tRNA reductase [Thermoleophilia bacterium]|nr:glutamyl-tRNA reductase [Thermoleophilia bacterium]
MLVVVVGISHATAPLELRERLALDGPAALGVARALQASGGACEAVALSTCNRTELYMYARDSLAAGQAALELLAGRAGCSPAALAPSTYSHSGEAAIAHLFRVVASLDSMVLGEYQIVAQIREAYDSAREGGCTSVVFNRLFRHALEVGKRVRTETAIGEKPVSVSSAAVDLAEQVFGRLDDTTALIIGAGETGELTATHLRTRGVHDILVTNRTFAAAHDMERRVGGRAVPFEDLEGHLAAADIVISSTSAPHFVVTRERVQRAARRRRGRPLFFIDIAVPRDLDPAIADLDGAFLYDIDDLEHVVARNRAEREKEAVKAEAIVTEELTQVDAWLRTLEVVPTIATLREAVEQIRESELRRLGSRLADLDADQRAQVELLTSSIVNKILHLPTVTMKEVAGRDECYLYVDAVRTLFGLNGNGSGVGPQQGEAARGEAEPTEPSHAATERAGPGSHEAGLTRAAAPAAGPEGARRAEGVPGEAGAGEPGGAAEPRGTSG